jgi:hypothetical protein
MNQPYYHENHHFIDRLELLKNLASSGHFTPPMITVITDLLLTTNVSIEQFYEILNGAYVVILDNKRFYKTWLKTDSKFLEFRTSSHSSNDPQFEIIMGYNKNNNIGGLLVGTSDKSTWFQLERHAFSSSSPDSKLRSIGLHGLDFIAYKKSGKNIGPFGESNHTENPWNPIYVKCVKGKQNLAKDMLSSVLKYDYCFACDERYHNSELFKDINESYPVCKRTHIKTIVKCSFCGAPSTNKSTCPLNPNINDSCKNYKKHYFYDE